MSSHFYFEIISGRSKSFLSSVLRLGLSVAELFYAGVVATRNKLFDANIRTVQRVKIPVVSVGNVTTGGTGKTPTVAWLVNWLTAQRHSPAILSRGYQSLDGEANDEKLLLDQVCPEVPHVQNRDRAAGAEELIRNSDCSVIVLDDGFQHRRLHRDYDLVLIDALNPFGYGHLLPRGLLRESLRGISRAQAILLTRCDQVSASRVEEIRFELAKYVSVPVLATSFRPTGLVNSTGETISFGELNGKRHCAFAGIGNPSGFRRTLSGVGFVCTDQNFRAFPDHHHYGLDDLKEIERWAKTRNAECLIATRKDLVKIQEDNLGRFPLWAVDIELVFLDPIEEFEKNIQQHLQF